MDRIGEVMGCEVGMGRGWEGGGGEVGEVWEMGDWRWEMGGGRCGGMMHISCC